MEMLWNFTDLNNFEKIKISDKDLLATIWSIILIFVGVTGNLLTLLAIPYAKWKNKYYILSLLIFEIKCS